MFTLRVQKQEDAPLSKIGARKAIRKVLNDLPRGHLLKQAGAAREVLIDGWAKCLEDGLEICIDNAGDVTYGTVLALRDEGLIDGWTEQ